MTANLKGSPAGSPGEKAIELARDGAYAAALPLLRRALSGPKPDPELRLSLALAYFHLGCVEAALRELRRAAKSGGPEVRRAALRKIAVYIPGAPKAGNAQILRARRQWALLEARAESPRLPARAPSRTPRRKLRIGYVSAFLGYRNWMKAVWGMLDAHDRRAFEIHLFLDRGLPDRRHGYVPHKSDRIHALDNLSNEAAAKRVAAAKVDILVDLSAYSYPSRLGLFLRKPAPIQVGWFALHATSGIDAFDYAIVDEVALPAREERFCAEHIVRVSGCYVAFAVPYTVPRVVAPPCARSGRITFGCLAPQYKLTDEVTATFARILRAVPGARLLLKNICMENAENRAAVRARFLRHGISGNQLVCEGPAEHFAFLKTYDRIDVALDTFPYNGGTTTMEALWQGVPVLTFPGGRWVSRISSSLLQAAGLGEWICSSRRSFLRRAIALARSPDTAARLSLLRAGLRDRLLASPACDVRGLCRQMEDQYRAMAGRRLKRRKGDRPRA
ncbi:MAG TPA: tetratricopeptide repeat protein [Opitutaceae bacterium]|nr:tetratricopeptide repeat protein [Opitutaceae bacterium]